MDGECSGGLMTAGLDWVKVDTREEACGGRLISRARSLRPDIILEGIKEFTVGWKEY